MDSGDHSPRNTEPALDTCASRARGSRVWMMRCSGAYSFDTPTAAARSLTRMQRLLRMDCDTMSRRLNAWICASTSAATAVASDPEVVTSKTCAMVSCSDLLAQAEHDTIALAESSAITSTSEGPAGR